MFVCKKIFITVSTYYEMKNKMKNKLQLSKKTLKKITWNKCREMENYNKRPVPLH